MKLLKNNLEANELRLAGNQHYKSYRFYEALICYNKSICKAIPGSEDFSLAFANRSAVYKEMKEFELCLENVKLAIDCGYPQNKLNVLLERQEKCLDMVDEVFCRTNPWDFFKLSYQNNEEIPFIVDCIELHESKEFGRHLRTNRTLKAGDIICIEEPFHKFIVNSARFTHCLNCLKSQQLNLFPCLKCDIGE
ncbi:CLUMA_CG006404, isoform A [Clunio marinus]|uniref:CLUMA_CG006404, isoform A n=1 Tax=Clunio marinus TaxID=568069 RepID=A0A1J1HZT8_9DIPT|nr:CLUMA_CG006404, isoform A [Clunio marinus]